MSSPSTIATALIAAASAVVVPVITAALAGLGFWLKERSDRRDRDNERHRVLTQVRQEIDVIEAWVKVYGLVAPPEDRSRASSNAQHDLNLAYTRLAHSLMESRGIEPRKTFHEHLKEFLLIGRLHSRSAKAVRVLYYVSLACAIIMVTIFFRHPNHTIYFGPSPRFHNPSRASNTYYPGFLPTRGSYYWESI